MFETSKPDNYCQIIIKYYINRSSLFVEWIAVTHCKVDQDCNKFSNTINFLLANTNTHQLQCLPYFSDKPMLILINHLPFSEKMYDISSVSHPMCFTLMAHGLICRKNTPSAEQWHNGTDYPLPLWRSLFCHFQGWAAEDLSNTCF